MKNLLEQLDRMKNLMVYEKGTSINEVSTSRSNNPTTETKSRQVQKKKKVKGVKKLNLLKINKKQKNNLIAC